MWVNIASHHAVRKEGRKREGPESQSAIPWHQKEKNDARQKRILGGVASFEKRWMDAGKEGTKKEEQHDNQRKLPLF